jgi:hypothetical protein
MPGSRTISQSGRDRSSGRRRRFSAADRTCSSPPGGVSDATRTWSARVKDWASTQSGRPSPGRDVRHLPESGNQMEAAGDRGAHCLDPQSAIGIEQPATIQHCKGVEVLRPAQLVRPQERREVLRGHPLHADSSIGRHGKYPTTAFRPGHPFTPRRAGADLRPSSRSSHRFLGLTPLIVAFTTGILSIPTDMAGIGGIGRVRGIGRAPGSAESAGCARALHWSWAWSECPPRSCRPGELGRGRGRRHVPGAPDPAAATRPRVSPIRAIGVRPRSRGGNFFRAY